MTGVVKVREGRVTKSSQIQDMMIEGMDEIVSYLQAEQVELTQDEEEVVKGFFQMEIADRAVEECWGGEGKRRGLARKYVSDLYEKTFGTEVTKAEESDEVERVEEVEG